MQSIISVLVSKLKISLKAQHCLCLSVNDETLNESLSEVLYKSSKTHPAPLYIATVRLIMYEPSLPRHARSD